ncbi:RNA polymerase sigma factor [Aestuariispira insulae]|uniref:RNA polymerase ECF family sigma subunit n=1 Tax=Aestuariispira insulae TaxID=1461337 RepID=A0A3D9HES9_9PROT|nr:RNA polymerase sigma factor [Aestuariispira insulae]RED47990.1 RNA polymerase ECF family sigma subunit [Aestuariispira insulae]
MAANPFLASETRDEEDAALAASAARGDREALEALIRRYQAWIYNLAVRMILNPQDAQELTQEALLRIITRIAQFEGRSSFRTWAYRIVTNCFLDAKRGQLEGFITSFDDYGRDLDAIPMAALTLTADQEPDRALIVEEAKLGCMLGMLLCLSREQRIVYTLGDIFEAPSKIAAEILGLSAVNFRQKLTRARRDLISFMQDKCGLINQANPCRCDRKAAGFRQAGWLEPDRLKFAGRHLQRIKGKVAAESAPLDDFVEEAYARLFRDHPMQEPLAEGGTQAILSDLLDSPEYKRIFDLP